MDYAETVRAELRTRCVWLRTKKAYFPLPQAGDVGSPAPTACWWCLKTLEALGPDGSAAEPTSCASDARRCYEGPVVL